MAAREPENGGHRYAIHADDRLVAISTVHPVGPVPVAVVLKLLPRHGAFGPMPAHEAIAEICRFPRHAGRRVQRAGTATWTSVVCPCPSA